MLLGGAAGVLNRSDIALELVRVCGHARQASRVVPFGREHLSGRVNAEGTKLSDHMSLIGVAMLGGQRRPCLRRAHRRDLPGTRKAEYSNEVLWGNSHRGNETPLQLAGRESQRASDLCDRRRGS